MLDVVLDLAAGAAAVAMSLARGADGPAAPRQRPDGRGARGRAASASSSATPRSDGLAQESATPQSVRQLADRFARQARSMVGADGVAVLAGPSSSARAAGEPSDAPLGRGRQGAGGHRDRALGRGGRRAPAGRSGPTTRSSSCRCSPGPGRSPSRRSRCPRGRPLEDEELEGLLLLGRIIGEAMARSELNAVSRRDAGRALGGGGHGSAGSRPSPRRSAASSTARRSPGSWSTPPRTGPHRASAS